ncbi:villin 2 [Hibiscus trionum]|uniref:Villin 2 n=1 Tax=Hibiscus trionum TaxID=183268 RepID=A0A9W7GXA0_HIBTR|nr:villin 2 [Hibiscus trionum]
MSISVKDPAFHGVGQKPGTEIWRIENSQPVPLPKSDYGKFYMGDSYIVLQTTASKGGSNTYDIHFWIGKDTSQDEAGAASTKAIELDAVLGGRAVQHRELQDHESDKILSYFKPCIVQLEGGIASEFKKPEGEFETKLYLCRGKRVAKLKQVPFARSSLNHDDVFILDTQNKIYQFNGKNSNIQERAKALEVTQYLKEKYHDGTCDVAIVEDGKLGTESNSGEFWVLVGGFAPLGKKVTGEDDVIPETTPAKLYRITDGELKPVETKLSKGLLENKKCYLLDCGAEVFVWVGRATQLEDRKASSQVAEDFVASENRAQTARITRVIQGYETNSFKSNFDSWPVGSTTAPGVEEGRGKVAAFLKQQGVKGKIKSTPVVEDVPPLLEGGGKMEVWRINGSGKTPLPKDDIGKFYSGDCYIVLYTYQSDEKKEDYFLCCWIGNNSIEEEQKTAYKLATAIFNSLKGRPVQGRVFEGKEPPQFIALFQPMLVLKGGQSTGYKKNIADKGLTDETYTADSLALFRISGTAIHNNKVVQVDAVASSLNSTECFFLQSDPTIFIWIGTQSINEQKQLATKIAALFKPGVSVKQAREGKESNPFWLALGGKQSYSSEKASLGSARDPHLFTFSLNKVINEVFFSILTVLSVIVCCHMDASEKFKVEEVYNFSQDDLLTEDILILDTHAEVFVWVGQHVDATEKQSVFEIAQKYIERAAHVDGLSPIVPLYKVTEGNEPCFFTTFFSWDPNRDTVNGNTYQKKLKLLFGVSQVTEDKPKGNQGGLTQRASALAALSSAFNQSPAKSTPSDRSRGNQGGNTQRAAALAALLKSFNPSAETKTSAPKPPTPSQGSQRASALAALSSAFNPSSEPKTSAPKNLTLRQASQRALAIAALSSVLTAESPKPSPNVSPKKISRSSSTVNSPPSEPETKSEVDPSEAEDSQEVVAKTNEEDSEPKEETEKDETESA